MLDKVQELREYLDISVLLAVIVSGLVGNVGLAVAGIAVYLLSDVIDKMPPTK